MTGVNRTILLGCTVGLLALGLCLTAGCGGGAGYEGAERAAVEGTVNFGGSPLAYGTLSFIPAEGESGRTANGLVVDGKYAIAEGQGPNLGKHKVRILGYAKAPDSGGGLGEEGDDSQGGSDDEEVIEGESVGEQILPEKYNAATELEVEITSGKNTHNFDLTP